MDHVTVACVLRSGGEYRLEHVEMLKRGVDEHIEHGGFICLSDVELPRMRRIPLMHGWPGWWAKMELFSPILHGDILYFDLDTVIEGPLTIPTRLTLLRDFYKDGVHKPERVQSGMMFLPEADRARVWERWIADPIGHMRAFRGDGEYLHSILFETADRWQDVAPGEVCSYKVHVREGIKPPNAKVICFHGKPRPWESGYGH